MHEMAHALTAKHLGCRVTSMGVALLVLFPVLYTDTTDAWRLHHRRERLAIVLAGIRMELHLALLATFLWSFLADGPLRSAAFFIATTSWLTSLAINLSPFMRFDGYYALADWLGAANLQPRAFALGRWRLREALFGLNEPPPEQLSRSREHIFILYGWATWIYRLMLFLGIALLIYYFAFKLLGIALFAVEIIWFVLLPVHN
jgi:putative peptide zinc metalloprotease protein